MLFTFTLMVPGFSKDSIQVNKSKQIEANQNYGQILDVDLTTERTTRVQIIVKNRDEICENHTLTVGPKGVVDGEFRGAVQWGCELPKQTEDAEYEVLIMVEGFAGNGAPVSYDVKSNTSESNLGFCFKEGA